MEIKCKNCGRLNHIGAIFCKDCGAKLEFKVSEKEVSKSEKKKKFNFSSFLKLVFIIIAGCIIYAGFNIIYPSIMEKDTDKHFDQSKASKAYKKILNIVYGDRASGTFSPEELSAVYNEYFFNDSMKHPLDISVSQGKFIKLKTKFRPTKYLDYKQNISLVGKPDYIRETPNSKQIKGFSVKIIKLGNLPILTISYLKRLKKYWVEIFSPYYNSQVRDIIKKIGDVKILKSDRIIIKKQN